MRKYLILFLLSLVFLFLIPTAKAVNYCSAMTTDYSSEWISKVELNSGVQDSVGSFYSDYTGTVFTNLTRGVTYQINVQASTIGNWQECVKIWIDWNHDVISMFSPAVCPECTIDLGCHNVNGNYTFAINFTVPAGATVVWTRMRVGLSFNTPPPADGCGSWAYGEVEDYSINIVTPTTTTTTTTSTSTSTTTIHTTTTTVSVCSNMKNCSIYDPNTFTGMMSSTICGTYNFFACVGSPLMYFIFMLIGGMTVISLFALMQYILSRRD